MLRRYLPLLAGYAPIEPVAFLSLEPARLTRPVGQTEEHRDADQDGRDRLENIHVEAEERRRDRRAGRNRDRQRQGKAGIDAAAIAVGEPIGEIKHEAGKQPGLGKTQQKADGHEAVGTGREGGGARDQPPGDHDPGDPQPRADLFEDDVARHLEEDIAPEEGAGRHAV